MDAVNALHGDAGDATPGLSARDTEILEFERQWWKYAGAKETAVREKFDMSSTRYYQVLNALIDRQEALEADPLLARRLRRLRAARQRQRSARRLGFEVWAMTGRRSPRGEGGVVFPSPGGILTVLAVPMAGIAFVATRDSAPKEKEITTISQPEATSTPTAEPKPTKAPKPQKPPVDRSKVYVVVFNNSNVTGLAGRVAAKAGQIGWQVVGSDNWYGTIPASTVYYPPRLERAGKLLALDLGIERTAPAVDPMRLDRLTVILTGPIDSVS